MNWVGGARSRVRQQAERKKQREFFERKRLEAKVKKVIRPKSPQERSSCTISKDLLFLQAVSKAHDGNAGVTQRHVKRLKLTEPRNPWPNRNIALPMSPIGKPSAIDIHDAACDAEVPSLFTRHAPRVSTQKIPHRTTLKSFGPPPLQQKKARLPGNRRRERVNPPTEDMSLWTESVFPKRETLAEFDDSSSSLMNESLGVEKRGVVGKRGGRKITRCRPGDTFLPERETREQRMSPRLELPNRVTRRRSLANAKKSYDRETPFTFDNHALEECHIIEMPRTKASLLDFHASENLAKQEVLLKGKEQERGKPFMLPTGQKDPNLAAELADKVSNHWDSPTPLKERASTSTTMTSFAFAENPLSRKAGPTSSSTVFNESVLGPIQRQDMGKRRALARNPPPQATQQLTTNGVGNGGGDGCSDSAFERMMSTFEAFEKTVVKLVEPPQEGSVDQLLSTNKGASNGMRMFGSETDKDKSTGEGFGTQSKKWQDFINGCTEHPQPVYTAVDKEWQEFTSGMDRQQESTTPSSSGELHTVPDNISDQQGQVMPGQYNETVRRWNIGPTVTEAAKDGSISTTVLATRASRLASISVMDELMCLEEIGSPSNASTAAFASQEISFTPVVCSRQVPDINARLSTQRCMSENPLKLCFTPTQCRPSAEVESMASERETESVTIVVPPPASSCETAGVSAGSSDYNNKLTSAEKRVCISGQCKDDCSNPLSRADKPSSGENAVCNEIQKECMDTNRDAAFSHDTGGAMCMASENVAKILNDTEPRHINGIKRVAIECGGNATPLDTSVFEIPAQMQDGTATAQQPPPILNEASQVQDGGKNLPDEDLCQEKYISVAVQCSLDSPSLSSLQRPSPLKLEDKSTQIFIPVRTTTAVQTTDDSTLDENSTSNCRSNTVDSCSQRECAQAEMADEVFALRKELDSMQNTVIWQALMLRLYRM